MAGGRVGVVPHRPDQRTRRPGRLGQTVFDSDKRLDLVKSGDGLGAGPQPAQPAARTAFTSLPAPRITHGEGEEVERSSLMDARPGQPGPRIALQVPPAGDCRLATQPSRRGLLTTQPLFRVTRQGTAPPGPAVARTLPHPPSYPSHPCGRAGVGGAAGSCLRGQAPPRPPARFRCLVGRSLPSRGLDDHGMVWSPGPPNGIVIAGQQAGVSRTDDPSALP